MELLTYKIGVSIHEKITFDAAYFSILNGLGTQFSTTSGFCLDDLRQEASVLNSDYSCLCILLLSASKPVLWSCFSLAASSCEEHIEK